MAVEADGGSDALGDTEAEVHSFDFRHCAQHRHELSSSLWSFAQATTSLRPCNRYLNFSGVATTVKSSDIAAMSSLQIDEFQEVE